ncbi:hypothetical protein XFF6990_200080 [Xanthomonas citri pv. fuscans]|uniref:Uncharacterized protein n=1 Tax=Xanthomonas campestris pv. phaseoli TaxID=317013 RepID=A0A7Z7J3G4_XANCH|nr:hypothetical protein XFF6990_200080 [Xanthomonas citri pv. fuscans]SOO25329.1 hypothetical protein XFF6991_450005 [Xanthomonas phaseoli pv. phaseoli]
MLGKGFAHQIRLLADSIFKCPSKVAHRIRAFRTSSVYFALWALFRKPKPVRVIVLHRRVRPLPRLGFVPFFPGQFRLIPVYQSRCPPTVPGTMLGGGCMRACARARIHTSEMRKMQNAQMHKACVHGFPSPAGTSSPSLSSRCPKGG